jgi:TatD DNase family protein
MFIDTHAHLDFPDYDSDREKVIGRTKEEGIDYIINVGATLQGSRASLELAQKYDFIYAAAGIHPHHAQEIDEKKLKELEGLAASSKVIAIGETGLDFFKNLSPHDAQEKLFRSSIRIAGKLNLPLIIHSREASEDTLRILNEEKANICGAVLHCYSYPFAIAEQILRMGFYISVAGQVTFPKSQGLRDVVSRIPLEKMLLETDCPFLAPQKFRGKRNEPGYVRYIAEELSRVYGRGIEEIAAITSQNAKRLFGLGK